MESLTRNCVSLKLLRSDRFCLRENSVDNGLVQSIWQHGLLQPLGVIRDGKQFQVISGHKRLAALKKNKIKSAAFFLIESQNQKQLFLTALLLNAASSYCDMDRCFILRKAEGDFGFSAAELIQIVLPQLGLPSSAKVLAQYAQIGKLSEPVLKLIRSQKIPFQGSAGLSRFKQSDLDFLIRKVFSRIKPTSSQLTHICEWLFDLMRVESKSVETIFRKNKLSLAAPSKDIRATTDQFYKSLRVLRFPALASKERAFSQVAKALQGGVRGLELRAPDHFEQEGFYVHAHIRNAKELTEVAKRMQEVQNQAAALFDTLL